MKRALLVVVTTGLLAVFAGVTLMAVMDIRGLPLIVLGLLLVVGGWVVAALTMRLRSVRVLVGLPVATGAVAVLGVLASKPVFSVYVVAHLAEYERLIERCQPELNAGNDCAPLLGEAAGVRWAVRVRREGEDGDRSVVRGDGVVDGNFGLLILRAANDTEATVLLGQPCTRHVRERWFFRYRCG